MGREAKDIEGRVHLLDPIRCRMTCGVKIGEHWGSALNIDAVNCPDCLAIKGGMSELEDRRQRALEAAHDVDLNDPRTDVEVAIEVATQVKLTPEIIEAASPMKWAPGAATARAVLEAAGFEVID